MSEALDLNRPESATAVGGELATMREELLATVGITPITDLATLEAAQADRHALAAAVDRVRAYFKPLKDTAYRLHKMLCEREHAIVDPLERRDAATRGAIADYQRAQARERARLEREAAALAHQADQDRAVAEAAALEARGEPALAAAVLAGAVARPAPVIVLPDPVAAIVPTRRSWHWRADHPALVPREFLMLDEKKINGYVRSMKASGAIPGIAIYFTDDPVR